MTRTSSLEVSIKTHIDCTLNISTIISTVLCNMYITARPVNNNSIPCISIVHMVAFVNLILKKLVVVVLMYCHIMPFICILWSKIEEEEDDDDDRLERQSSVTYFRS